MENFSFCIKKPVHVNTLKLVLDVKDLSPFLMRLYAIKEEQKLIIEKKNDWILKIGIIKKG